MTKGVERLQRGR